MRHGTRLVLGFAALTIAATGGCGGKSDSGRDTTPSSSGGSTNATNATTNGGGDTSGGATTNGGGDTSDNPSASGGGPDVASGGSAAGTSCGAKVVNPSKLPACTSCTGGRCVAKADYPNAPISILSACDNGDVCLPDTLVATKGNVALQKCTSVLGNEGRCTSLCIPIAQSLSAVLPQDTCAADERCAPCFNPTDGSSTGICQIGCDPGPSSKAILFATCCGGRGDCVPRADIPGPAAQNLSAEKCTGSDDPVCVPSSIVQNPTYVFPTCTSSVSVPGVAAGPGVCVPDCVVDANPLGVFLGAGTCTTPGDKCAPCNDPTGKPTGACAAP